MKKFVLLSFALLLISGCVAKTNISREVPDSLAQNANVEKYQGKKILYIDSYHEGYEWSDGIVNGLEDAFSSTGLELSIFRMDTKRNTSEDFKKQAALKAKIEIEKIKPDLVISSDDNAFKYLIMPFYKDKELPVVFCAINWDASLYDAPYKNTTGMVEVALVSQLIEHLKKYAAGDKVGFLAGDSVSSHKEADYPEKLFGLKLNQRYVTTLAEWKTAFIELQEENDVVYLHNNAGINDWDVADAKKFVEENITVPTGAIYTWMMPYSLVGLTVRGEEQGEWSAKAALRILDGEKPADIPLVRNKQGDVYVNLIIANKLGITLEPSLLKNAEIIK